MNTNIPKYLWIVALGVQEQETELTACNSKRDNTLTPRIDSAEYYGDESQRASDTDRIQRANEEARKRNEQSKADYFKWVVMDDTRRDIDESFDRE